MTISFFVPGIPAPGGSKTSVYSQKHGRTFTFDSCKRNKPWRSSVEAAAAQAMSEQGGNRIMAGPITVAVTFYMPRPKGHYGSGKNAGKIKPSAPSRHIVKPDTTKLWRAAEDAMKGIVWVDDAQIVNQNVGKMYANDSAHLPGVSITVDSIEEAR